jgi:hypothetical protein
MGADLMALGDDLAAALPGLRSQAESMMLDRCTVTRTSTGSFNDVTGVETVGSTTTLYDGPCRFRMARGGGSPTDSGEAEWTLNGVTVSLPVSTSGDVRTGDAVTLTESAFDPDAVGTVAQVKGIHVQTYATARRLECEVVTRDA